MRPLYRDVAALKSIPDSEVLQATHKFGKPTCGWTKYPQAQLDAAQELAKLLVREYGLEDVVGHDEHLPQAGAGVR